MYSGLFAIVYEVPFAIRNSQFSFELVRVNNYSEKNKVVNLNAALSFCHRRIFKPQFLIFFLISFAVLRSLWFSLNPFKGSVNVYICALANAPNTQMKTVFIEKWFFLFVWVFSIHLTHNSHSFHFNLNSWETQLLNEWRERSEEKIYFEYRGEKRIAVAYLCWWDRKDAGNQVKKKEDLTRNPKWKWLFRVGWRYNGLCGCMVHPLDYIKIKLIFLFFNFLLLLLLWWQFYPFCFCSMEKKWHFLLLLSFIRNRILILVLCLHFGMQILR